MNLTIGKKSKKDQFKAGLKAVAPIGGTVGAIGGAVGGAMSKGSTKLKVASSIAGAAAGGLVGKAIGNKFKTVGKKKNKFSSSKLTTFKKAKTETAIIGQFPKPDDTKSKKKKSVIETANENLKNKDKLPEQLKTTKLVK